MAVSSYKIPSITTTKFQIPWKSESSSPIFLKPRKREISVKSTITPWRSPIDFPGSPAPYADPEPPAERLADCWRKIHGEDEWAGLLDPMGPILRAELIRYGEMAQACYDAFDFDPLSVNCGSCKFSKEQFFTELDMEGRGYTITRYLYATSTVDVRSFFNKSRHKEEDTWSSHANWIGYVAVSDEKTSVRLGRRDITVAWRGTVTKAEWTYNLMDILRPISTGRIPCLDPSVKIESGFGRLYTGKVSGCEYCHDSPRRQVLDEIERLVGIHGDEKRGLSITMTGHSLGSALAVLSAFDVAETGRHLTPLQEEVPVSVFSFSGPRVGNRSFKERLEKLGVNVLRVHNKHDYVPSAPGLFVNEHWPRVVSLVDGRFPWCYSHVGTELVLDHEKSTFIKEPVDPAEAHNLELLLHLIDGYHGRQSSEGFNLAGPRDAALMNKDADLLKDEFKIPPKWRQDRNRGMVKDKNGHWTQRQQPRPDHHHHHHHGNGMVSHLSQEFGLHSSN